MKLVALLQDWLTQSPARSRNALLALHYLDGLELVAPGQYQVRIKGIEAGLALRVVYEIALSRVRGYWPDATVAELEQTAGQFVPHLYSAIFQSLQPPLVLALQ